jgi:hypothetical protein
MITNKIKLPPFASLFKHRQEREKTIDQMLKKPIINNQGQISELVTLKHTDYLGERQ